MHIGINSKSHSIDIREMSYTANDATSYDKPWSLAASPVPAATASASTVQQASSDS